MRLHAILWVDSLEHFQVAVRAPEFSLLRRAHQIARTHDVTTRGGDFARLIARSI